MTNRLRYIPDIPSAEFDEARYLKADVGVVCDTEDHATIIALAWTAVAVYPIGMLAFTSVLLACARQAIVSRRPTALSRATSFLWESYHPDFFWWELVEKSKQLVLVGLMVLLQGSTMQLVLGTLFALIFMLFQVQLQPYASIHDDYLASACSFSLSIMFLCSMSYKHAMLLDLPDIQDKLSREQRSIYLINGGTLTIILMISVLGALIALALILSTQLREEAQRLRRDERMARARRLRYLKDGREAIAPELSARRLPEWAINLGLHGWHVCTTDVGSQTHTAHPPAQLSISSVADSLTHLVASSLAAGSPLAQLGPRPERHACHQDEVARDGA